MISSKLSSAAFINWTWLANKPPCPDRQFDPGSDSSPQSRETDPMPCFVKKHKRWNSYFNNVSSPPHCRHSHEKSRGFSCGSLEKGDQPRRRRSGVISCFRPVRLLPDPAVRCSVPFHTPRATVNCPSPSLSTYVQICQCPQLPRVSEKLSQAPMPEGKLKTCFTESTHLEREGGGGLERDREREMERGRKRKRKRVRFLLILEDFINTSSVSCSWRVCLAVIITVVGKCNVKPCWFFPPFF